MALLDKEFGRLRVVRDLGSRGGLSWWGVICACGGYSEVRGIDLISGNTKSCGCQNATTHGLSRSAEYKAWQALIQRCYNPNNPKFKDYGGRGIEVWAPWRDNFAAFFAHVGAKPDPRLSIERKDNNGGYFPGNVKWETVSNQNRNRRRA